MREEQLTGSCCLDSPAWSEIASRPLTEIKKYMLSNFREYGEYYPDEFGHLFGESGRVSRLLDFGCGIGRNFEALSTHCSELYGYDIPAMVSACKRHHGQGRQTVTADWSEVSSRRYDLTVAAFSLQHIESDEVFRFYIESLSKISDYLYINGRSWRDGPPRLDVLQAVLGTGCFTLVSSTPDLKTIIKSQDDRALHFKALLRTTRTALHQTKNQETLENTKTVTIPFNGFDVLFDAAPLMDHRGIGRINKQLLDRLRRMALHHMAPASAEMPADVNFYGTIHWCPEQLSSPSVVLVHDVIPLKFPEYFKEAALDWRNRLRPIARQADIVATVSESSAVDIQHHLGIPKSRIRVVPNGVSKLDGGGAVDLEIPQLPYLVYVGADDPHKNVRFLLDLIEQPELANYSLAMVGNLGKLSNEVASRDLTDRVTLYGRVNDSVIARLIKGSHALLFPSLYEGFGLPPFEGGLLGVPSVCSNRPAMSTLLHNCVDLVEPYDVNAWIKAIQHLEDPAYRKMRVDSIAQRAAEFSIDSSVNALVEVFKELSLRRL